MRRSSEPSAPRVGLINIGAEETKGTELQVAALPLLKNLPGIHFIGNVEARDLPLGGCDVAVCDGFTGNIVLKLTEGMGKFIGGAVKEVLMHNLKTKLGALLIASEFGAFKKTLDYKETGGAPILGVTRPVIKAHGSSDARAFKNAIRQAKSCVERDVSGAIEAGSRGRRPPPGRMYNGRSGKSHRLPFSGQKIP